MKATVKESVDGVMVTRTLDRSKLWEIQTPQIIRPGMLREGFERAAAENWEVSSSMQSQKHTI